MKSKKIALLAAAAALAATPAIAQVAGVPNSAPVSSNASKASGESVVIGVLSAAAIIGGIVILASRSLDHVIELEVNEDALVERITGRFSCANCGALYHDTANPPAQPGKCDACGSTEFKRRPDDNEETVRTRMAEYRAKTAPILPGYETRGIVTRVDGMGMIDVVASQIDTILKS